MLKYTPKQKQNMKQTWIALKTQRKFLEVEENIYFIKI